MTTEQMPSHAPVVDPLVKAGIGPHATRSGFLCVTVTGALTGVHHFSASVKDWLQLAEALRRMAEPARTVSVPPAAIEPDELDGAAEHATRVVGDWVVTGGTLQGLAMAMTANIARRIEAESGRTAAVELFDALAQLVREAPPLADDAMTPRPH